ncbi:hypothetical protein J2S30_003353 [Herbaspirillum rubrisubalbicans]|nr:hypothetical protein [Herbaspirillum rubrisubalbicans]
MTTASPTLLYLSRADIATLGGQHSQPYVDAIGAGLGRARAQAIRAAA